MYTQIEKRLELAELLIQVLENPAENRVIVETQLPNLDSPWEEDNYIYYMIDKSDGDTQSETKTAHSPKPNRQPSMTAGRFQTALEVAPSSPVRPTSSTSSTASQPEPR